MGDGLPSGSRGQWGIGCGTPPAAWRLGALLLVGGTCPLAAQSLGLDPDRDLPAWLSARSPLAPRADLPRRLPSAGTALPLGVFGAPRIGLFWTAGNPAGLARELTDTRSDFFGGVCRTQGDYRRPLDPGAASLKQAWATSWTPIDSRFNGLGRVVLDQERLDPGTHSDETEPYPTSPFVTADTATSAVRRTRARLEGAAGWRLGGWALGAIVGYDTRENQTIQAGFVRRTRQAMSGVTVGVSRLMGGVALGLHARYRRRAETINLTERAGFGRVIDLEGYRNVQPLYLGEQFYHRRIDENVPSAGASASGTMGRVRWVVYADLARLRERRTRQEQDNPVLDRWNADSWTTGGELQRAIGVRGLLTLAARYTRLTGTGDLALDSTSVLFTANEHLFDGSSELRIRPAVNRWSGVLVLRLRQERRIRNDSVAAIGTAVRAATLGASVAVSRSLSDRMGFELGADLGNYVANSQLPAPSRGAVYLSYIAPELDVYARNATPYAVNATLRWRASARAGVWAAARYENLNPQGVSPSGVGPGGSRTAGYVLLGVTVGHKE